MALVLTIDDSTLQRRNITGIVKSAGYDSIEASGGREAVELIGAQKPDCILLDLLMPDMDGFKVLNALNSMDVQIPVIVLTADIQETTRQECMRLGAVEVINKPPNKEKVLAALKTHIKKNP